jgi:hypothetical protein
MSAFHSACARDYEQKNFLATHCPSLQRWRKHGVLSSSRAISAAKELVAAAILVCLKAKKPISRMLLQYGIQFNG